MNKTKEEIEAMALQEYPNKFGKGFVRIEADETQFLKRLGFAKGYATALEEYRQQALWMKWRCGTEFPMGTESPYKKHWREKAWQTPAREKEIEELFSTKEKADTFLKYYEWLDESAEPEAEDWQSKYLDMYNKFHALEDNYEELKEQVKQSAAQVQTKDDQADDLYASIGTLSLSKHSGIPGFMASYRWLVAKLKGGS